MGQKRTSSRAAQWPLLAEFYFNFDDSVVDVNGASKPLNVFGSAIVFDAINLPVGAIIQGGEVVTEVAVVGSTAYTVSVGDSANIARYLAATDKTAAGRTVLVPTGYVSQGENIRLSVTPTVANPTAGRVSLRVWYSIRDRANETYPT
jgi:hypothetical protein